MKNEYLECGKIINKRGICGELKVDCYCDSPESIKRAEYLFSDKKGEKAHRVISIKNYKGFLYIKLDDIKSAEEADAVRGSILYVKREDVDVDEGKNFIADLIGLEVIDFDSGIVYGKIKDVINYGASDIYVITDGKNEYMLPAVEGIVKEINLEEYIKVVPIPGIFTDAEEIR